MIMLSSPKCRTKL